VVVRLRDKVAIVTGASRGIGRATALALAAEGARVVVNYNARADAAEQVVAEITAAGGRATAHQADVGDFAQAEALVKATIQSEGDLHILVNNAGITRDGLILTMTEADWDIVLRTNLKSTFACSKAAVRHMLRRRYGRIVNITSVAGQIGNPGQSNYSASKAGQIGFTRSLAREVASRNITVNAVAAGFIETEIWTGVPAEAQQALLRMIPLGRKGTADDIARAVVFLASDEAAYVTGHVLSVDGGMAMA
jgi:3-oxoacyl-[acyl-carrier protein] reductase